MKFDTFLAEQEAREIHNLEMFLDQALESGLEQVIMFAKRAIYPIYEESVAWSEGRFEFDEEIKKAYETIR